MKVQNLVPEIYYKDSRDFSFIGRLYEILFNYLNTATDLVGSSLYDTNSETLIDLLCYKLGFEVKHKYINSDLLSVCKSFVSIMKKKGTKSAIEESIQILLNSQYLDNDYEVLIDRDTCNIGIGLPVSIQDTVLLEDLFDYILPAGWTYNLYYVSRKQAQSTDVLELVESIPSYKRQKTQLSQVARPETVDDLKENVTPIFYDDTTGIDNDGNHSNTYIGLVHIKEQS